MKELLLVVSLMLHAIGAFGQNQTDCSWVEQLKATEDTDERLSILQQNHGSCAALVVADGTPVSSQTSAFYFPDAELFIQKIRPGEIEFFNFLEGEAAKTLYGQSWQIVIVITFKKERTKYRVRNRVIRQLRRENKL